MDEIIDRFLNLDFYRNHNRFYLVTLVDLACTVIAFCALFRLGREEWRELRTFGFGGKMDTGSAVMDNSISNDKIIIDLSIKRHINRVAMGDHTSSMADDDLLSFEKGD